MMRGKGWRWGMFVLAGVLLAAWVLSVSRPGTAVEGCADCRAAAPRREGALRVMTLNVLHDFPRFEDLSQRLDLVAEAIGEHDADIVCLNEVPWTARLGNGAQYLANKTGLNYVYGRANGNKRAILFEEGEAILSRYPLRDASLTELKPRAGFFEHRMVLQATAVTQWGDVRVFVTHLTAGDATVNRQQAAALQAIVAATGARPAFVAGDLNAREDSPQIVALGRSWQDTYLAARSRRPGDAGPTCCVDDIRARSARLEKRIDYLFFIPTPGGPNQVESSRRVLDQAVQVEDGWLWASDHVGVMAAVDMDW